MSTANLDLTNPGAPADLSSTCRRQVAYYTGPASYDATNGDVVDPASVRMGKLFIVIPGGLMVDGATTYALAFDAGTGAFFWFVAATGVAVGNGTNLSNATGYVEAIGQ